MICDCFFIYYMHHPISLFAQISCYNKVNTMTNTPPIFTTPQKQYFISQTHTYTISPIQTLSPTKRPSSIVTKEQIEGSPQQKILKDMSSRVKHLIKDNQKSTHQHTQDIMILKKSNQDMQTIIDEFKNKQSFKPSLREVDYKLSVNDADPLSTSQMRDSSNLYSKGQTNNDYLRDSSLTLGSLKRQLLTYINTAIQANDQKMWKQQKYISSLQRRVANLDQIQTKVQHFKFERAVKLQESSRKSKNFSLRTPQILGDKVGEDNLQFSPTNNQGKQIKFFQNPYKKYRQNDHSNNTTNQQYASLYKSFASLQEQHSLLKQKHEIQVEIRMKDTLENQKNVEKIKKLSSQIQSNKFQIFTLNERLTFAQERYNDLQIFLKSHKSRISGKILPNIPPSLSSQLASIVTELRVCGVDKYRTVQRQINDILIQNDYLRAEVGYLQGKIVQACKFSCTHREVFHLKEKNHELELHCRSLQKKLQEYSPTNISKLADKEEDVNLKLDKSRCTGGELQCVKWARLVHFCMTSTLGRLQAIRKQLKPQTKP